MGGLEGWWREGGREGEKLHVYRRERENFLLMVVTVARETSCWYNTSIGTVAATGNMIRLIPRPFILKAICSGSGTKTRI